MSGTAGPGFFGVLKRMPDGRLVALPIEPERKDFQGRQDIYHGLRGHLRLDLRQGRLIEIFPVQANDHECNACSSGGERHFSYRWDGHQFVLGRMVDLPPAKEGS